MIALISFEKEFVVSKEEAGKLGLKYTKGERYGIKDGDVAQLRSYDFYIDELFSDKSEDSDIIHYYQDETKTKEVTGYYRYKRAPEEDWVTIDAENHLVNLDEFVLKCKRKFYIREAIPTQNGDPTSLMVVVDRVTKKFDEMLRAAQNLESQQFNERCHVHVGGGLITTYNELKLKEDVCTDELQGELNGGWRIIAVCVQPDQRRSDYILGRYNPELDPHDSALR